MKIMLEANKIALLVNALWQVATTAGSLGAKTWAWETDQMIRENTAFQKGAAVKYTLMIHF